VCGADALAYGENGRISGRHRSVRAHEWKPLSFRRKRSRGDQLRTGERSYQARSSAASP
jgi:hypothetical protein